MRYNINNVYQRMLKFAGVVLSLFLSFPMLNAQEMEIVDVTALTQLTTGKDTKQMLVLTKDFVASERGAGLLNRLNACVESANNEQLSQSARKAQEYANGKSPADEADKYYDELIAYLDKDFAKGYMSRDEYEKKKAEIENRRKEFKKELAKEMKQMSEMMGKVADIADKPKMKDTPKELLNDLIRNSVGGKTWRHATSMGKGIVMVSDGNALEYSWGVMNVIDTPIFPEQYQVYAWDADSELIILENDSQQRGLFRYDGTELIAFNDNEMWLDLGHPIVNTGKEFQALDHDGKLMFAYPEIRSFEKYWTVKGDNVKWGVVDNNGEVLVPIKYCGIFDADSNGKHYIGGFITSGSNDMDLYDPETWQMVGKRINQKVILK